MKAGNRTSVCHRNDKYVCQKRKEQEGKEPVIFLLFLKLIILIFKFMNRYIG